MRLTPKSLQRALDAIAEIDISLNDSEFYRELISVSNSLKENTSSHWINTALYEYAGFYIDSEHKPLRDFFKQVTIDVCGDISPIIDDFEKNDFTVCHKNDEAIYYIFKVNGRCKVQTWALGSGAIGDITFDTLDDCIDDKGRSGMVIYPESKREQLEADLLEVESSYQNWRNSEPVVSVFGKDLLFKDQSHA